MVPVSGQGQQNLQMNQARAFPIQFCFLPSAISSLRELPGRNKITPEPQQPDWAPGVQKNTRRCAAFAN
jgi:hypothetical protein